MFGPGKVDEYIKRLENPTFVHGPDCQPILPPTHVGKTIQTLLEKGILFTSNQRKKWSPKSDIVRGWNMADFWEQTTWPRDSSGGGNTRFGFPVKESFEDLEAMGAVRVLAPPSKRPLQRQYVPSTPLIDREPSTSSPTSPEEVGEHQQLPTQQKNPFVKDIAGVRGMQQDIMNAQLDCLLFLSAKFCKTCKSINPLYTRMARLAMEEPSDDPTKIKITFAKAEASGMSGKELGKALEVDAVPAFILFRKGEQFGTPLSVSKLPSKKIDRALALLQSGSEWDPSILEEES